MVKLSDIAFHSIFKENEESRIFVNDNKIKAYKIIKNILKTNNIWGLFVTIERSKKTQKKANTNMVHGCQGTFGDNNYTNLTYKIIYDYILDKANASAYQDNRKNLFLFQDLKNDKKAKLEISLLKNPIYKINFEDGFINDLNIYFNNRDFGIIMDDNGNKATYLPNVFPNKSWIEIRNDLVENKAGKQINPNINFFAYRIYHIESSLDNSLKILNKNYTKTKKFKKSRKLTKKK